MKKRFFSILLAVCLVICAFSVTALADGTGTTIDLSQGSYTITEAGTYTVKGGVTTTNALTVNAKGNVTITLNGVTINALADNSAISIESGNVTLNVTADSTLTGGDNGAGVYVAENASVTITGTATLTAIGNAGTEVATPNASSSGAAGIGGTKANGNSGAITIDGATVVAKGYGAHGSGIGSGSGKVVGEIKIINGANVTAYGGYYANGAGATMTDKYGDADPEGGAGIGGGGKTASTIADITIDNSTVKAYAGYKAAGIGANFWSNAGTITISGDNSDVTAYGGSGSAGIGTSRIAESSEDKTVYGSGAEATIVINGGKVTAIGGEYGAGIGSGYNAESLGNGASASALPEMDITISGGKVTATGGEGGAGIGGGYKTDNVDIDITGGAVTASAGALVNGKTVENGGSASAIGAGANGSGVFENQPAVEIGADASVKIETQYETTGGKSAVEGYTYKDGQLVAPWYNPDATEYHITCEEDLWAFAAAARALVDAGEEPFTGKTVYLDTDIDLNWADWYPINFYGTFEGGNHTIKNLTYIPRDDGRMGFFQLTAGPVSNLTLDGIKGTVPVNGRFGGFARYLNGVATNVHVKNINVTTTDTSAWVGGFTTYTAGGRTVNCTVENLTVDATAGADLIAGFASLTSNRQLYENSDVIGFKVTVTDTDSSGCGVGGWAGQTQTGWNNPKFKDCDISGIDVAATGLVDVGGFIAWPGAHTEYAENCTTEGKIDVTGVTSDGCFAGGFFGNLGWNCDLGYMGHVVTNCSADVDIITKIAPAGGFVGSATNSNNNSMYATFNNCSASGDVTCVVGGTADIGGFAGDADRGAYNGCSASGTVTNNGSGYAGQYIGAIYDVTPKYDGRYPAGTRDYLVDEIDIADCTYTGASTELEFIGNTAEGADVTIADYVAQIGEVRYQTLAEAVAAANAVEGGATVTLLDDVSLDAALEITGNVTLDGADNVLTGANNITVAENASLSVIGGTYDVDPTGWCAEGYGAAKNEGGTWTVKQEIDVNVSVEPADAVIVIKDAAGNVVDSNEDGTYTLLIGETYSYTVSKSGYISLSGDLTASEEEPELAFELEKEPVYIPVAPVVKPVEKDEACDGGVECPAFKFSDVDPDAWYHEAIDFALVEGLMNGVGGNKFNPGGSFTRAMMWTVLARQAGVDTDGGETWYSVAQAWAVKNGVSDGTDPMGSITREQLVTMLWRYLGEPEAKGDLSDFVDGDDVSEWAEEAMIWAVANKVISGRGNGILAPQGLATRAEVAQIFKNYFE